MQFSIIICTYSCAEKLPKTLDSILAQDFNDYEVVVVDGASTDGTCEIIKKYEKEFAGRLKWISEKDSGLYNALNKGVRMARGNFLNVVGAGDWLEKKALAEADNCIKKNPEADAVHGKLRVWDKEIKNSYLLQTFPQDLKKNPMQHPALFYKKALHEKFGMYDETYKIVSDYLFCMKAFLIGNAKAAAFGEVVDNFVTDGISSTNIFECERENLKAKQELGLTSFPLVSIVMPVYNQKKYILETINSIVNQVYPNWECVMVDDGSTDGTDKVAEEIAGRDLRFKYVSQKNSGPSAARNRGISESKGEYILPLDSDDLISPYYIKEAVDVFLEKPETKLVYCGAEYFGERNGKWDLPDYSYADIFFSNMIFCSAVFRKADFEEAGGFNANMWDGLEDWDFWLSFLNEGDVVFKIPRVHFFYRIKSGSRNETSHRSLNAILEMHRRILLNHKEKYRRIIRRKFLKNFPDDLLNNINSREGGLENLAKFRKISFAEQTSKNFRLAAKKIKAKFSFTLFSPQKFSKKYLGKFLNGPLRQPARKIWYAIRLKKIK